MSHRILLVDDEPHILDAFRRTLRGRYLVITSSYADEALDILENAKNEPAPPFAVIVSDMIMPVMNGASFLAKAKEIAPDAVQMILSGQADLESTIEAVNNGSVFRFLNKPCSPEDLAKALDDALRQYGLVMAERELLERTLQGAVEVLMEVLSLASPQAFSRTSVIRELVEATAKSLGMSADWQLPLAAMLSQLGCVTIPGPVLSRAKKGTFLTADEEYMFARHPQLARDLLQRIPRLELVAEWVGDQPVQIGKERPLPEVGPAAVFAATAAFVLRCEHGESPRLAIRDMSDSGNYPRAVLDALAEAAGSASIAFRLAAVSTMAASSGREPGRDIPGAQLGRGGMIEDVLVSQVCEGMVLEQDVVSDTGMMLIRRGERVTAALAARLTNFSRTVGVREPIRVIQF